jgi:Ca2+-binding RTX toxin-like protein
MLSNVQTGAWDLATNNLPQRLDFTHCAAVGDINNDGLIDIFLGNVDTSGSPVEASFLINQGQGRFSENTQIVPSLITQDLVFYATQMADLNADGWSDLIIGNSGSLNTPESDSLVFWNQQGSFSANNISRLPHGFFGNRNEQILDIQASDLDQDGFKDLVVVSTQNNPFYDGWAIQLLRNNKDGSFTDITNTSFDSVPHMGQANRFTNTPWLAFTKLLDLNGDGFLDILPDQWGGASPNSWDEFPIAFINDGFGKFETLKLSEVIDTRAIDPYFMNGIVPYQTQEGVSWLSSFAYRGEIYIREMNATRVAATYSTSASSIDAIGLSDDGQTVLLKVAGVTQSFSIGSSLEFVDALISTNTLMSTRTVLPVFQSSGGTNGYVLPEVFTGPDSLNLDYQLIETSDNAVVIGGASNDFIKVASAQSLGKAVDGGGGDDVIDGGVGSTFITGGAGSNTIFLDGRAPGVSWSTVTDFKLDQDKATIWGWKEGVSKVSTSFIDFNSGGAPGYTGLTLHFENLLPDNAALGQTNSNLNSITLSNRTLADFGATSLMDLNTQITANTNSHFQVGVVSDVFGDHGYLFIS